MSKVLIVEDEEAIADIEKDYLELSGFTVTTCKDGTSGLAEALDGDYDIYILDVMLPGIDGFEICKKIREVKNTPIIMVSAKKEDIDKIRGLGVGADDYMTKPFSPSELVARVKAHLSRYERLVNSAQPENDIIEIRGIKIDKTARRVFVNGEEKVFTTKEFDLLTFLAEHPNHVYTKEELFKEIWDMDSIGDIATVTVHIKKIREKIELNTLDGTWKRTALNAKNYHNSKKTYHHNLCDTFNTFLQSHAAGTKTECSYDYHPEGHFSRIGEHGVKYVSYRFCIKTCEGAACYFKEVSQHPAAYSGVKHHQHIVAKHGSIAVKVPFGALWLKEMEASGSGLAACASDSKFHNHNRQSKNYKEQKIDQYKCCAAVLSCYIREAPYIADSNGAAG